ncbi:MAG TPA: endonuclease/exonuclease/phosphatase family protein, partial [Actinomycetota bacterium]|nr:endonuclease/exonuclease/phosphatase family protein [Actinomycetota bacterium]
IEVPDPVGRVVFVNHATSFELTHEAERERQAVAVADVLERLVAAEPAHVIVAGDLNAGPDAASIRFWTGKQSLDGVSVCYRDAWAAQHAGEPGHTFTPNNTLTTTAEDGRWELELGRRIDYILVRCTEHGPTLDIRACRRFLDSPVDGVWASDHFGVTADLSALSPTGRHPGDGTT